MLFTDSTANLLAILLLGPIAMATPNQGKTRVEPVKQEQQIQRSQTVREPLTAKKINPNGEDSNDPKHSTSN